MRTIGIAGAVLALVAADGVGAQRMVAHGPGADYPAPQAGDHDSGGPQVRPVGVAQGGHRWGSKVGGRWWGGVNAPGGWNGYRRPYRGYVLPGYWISPRFGIDDWSTYGLSQPPYGYSWRRYYDDAVLVDAGGSVYDTVGGIDWDRYDGGYDSGETVYAGSGDRGHDGVGGALAGAAVGGVAGNLIAGRGNRLGGTLIGAGVGAAAGYAIDRSSRRPEPAYGYGAGYPQPPVAPRHAPPPPRDYGRPLPPEGGYPPPPPSGGRGGWMSPDGSTTVTTTSGGYYGGSTTTVVVRTAPIVTTTTTELIEDDVTYMRPHRKWHRRVSRAPVSKVHVRCGC